MKRRIVHEGIAVLDLLEEAAHLLRRAPAAVLGAYYLGAVPFVVGLLFFWADMSRGAMAHTRCAATAGGLALLYVWMRTWQARFGAGLRAVRADRPRPDWTAREFAAVAAGQLRWASWSFLALGPSLLAVIPFGWLYAYHQGLTVLHDQPATDPGSLPARARAQGALWPLQNHYVLVFLLLFSLFVWINLAFALGFLPYLVKMFLGIESVFTRYPFWVFNTTFLAAVTALVYLAVDPLVKAAYVLRCYYGESIRDGRDLRTDLRRVAPARPAALALLLLLATAAVPARAQFESVAEPVSAGTGAPAAAKPTVDPARLDGTIERVMGRPEFTWRQPRDAGPPPGAEQNAFARFMNDTAAAIKRGMQWIGRTLERVIEWVRRIGRRATPGDRGDGFGSPEAIRRMSWILLGVIGVTTAIIAFRAWRRRARRAETEVEAAPLPATPDLEDEQVNASHLPEEEWRALAEQLRAAGELRKALRAVFLATLAGLGRCGLIDLAPAKSNLDYRRELERRTRGGPPVAPVFADDVAVFERGWYGRHPVTGELLDGLLAHAGDLRRLRPESAPEGGAA